MVGAITSVTLPAAALAALLSERRAHALMRTWSRASLRALGPGLTIEDHNGGAYPDPPYLFVHLNQTSLLETFVYAEVVPMLLRVVMNVEFALIPVVGSSLAAMGSRIIVRQRPAQAKRTLSQLVAKMRQTGRSFAISVEGRRSPDGALLPYKSGAAHLAISSQARVVPFFVHGTHEAMPMGSWRPRAVQMRAVVLEAIDTRGMQLSERHALTERLRALAEQEQRAGAEPPMR